MDFARSPRVFSPIHHDLPFLLIRSHNNTEISITLTRNSYLTDQYDFNLDAIIAYHHIRLSIIASYHLFMDLSIQHSFLVTPLCPFATCDLDGVTPAPPIRLKWPDPIDGALICRVATYSGYTPQSGTLTDIILCGGVGAQPITTPVAGQPPEEITLERALSDFLSCYYPSPLMIMIQSSPLPTTHVIMLFERFTVGCALSRFSPGSPPARLILGVPLLGSPPGHHHVIITSSSTRDRASDEPLQRALGVRGST